MADAVAGAIARRATLVAEAGTGTGKTFAYLVPALLYGGKVIVSTGTKTLQDQLFQRDLPTVRDALGIPATLALLKGRANYVCHHHLERTASEGRLAARDDARHLPKIIAFARRSHSGDRGELADVPENASIWPLVTSTRDNCLGSDCAFTTTVSCSRQGRRRWMPTSSWSTIISSSPTSCCAMKDCRNCCRLAIPLFSTRHTSCRIRQRCSSANR
jgi:Rad3-related DNA helicase